MLTCCLVSLLAFECRKRRLESKALEDTYATKIKYNYIENNNIVNHLFPRVVELSINSNKLKTLDGVAALKQIRRLSLLQCDSLSDISAVGKLDLLEELTIQNSPRIVDLSALASIPKLKCLCLVCAGDQSEVSVEVLSQLTHLESLFVECSEIGLDAIPKTNSLVFLRIFNCDKFSDVEKLEPLVNLEILSFGNCNGLKKFVPLKGFPKLQYLDFDGCRKLENIRLEKCQNLEVVGIKQCRSLDSELIARMQNENSELTFVIPD